MLRVVIADDEERICKLIAILADWDRLGMEVAGVAHNGQEALALLTSLRPDILITDIRMPGYDGLEVIRRMRQTLPALEAIIISGYAQFDYAQTAIQYGVGDYLLKPINRDALNNTLEKIGERCVRRMASAQAAHAMAQTLAGDRQRRRESLLADLLGKRYRAKTLESLNETYCLRMPSGILQAFVLRTDYDTFGGDFGEKSLAIVKGRARDILGPILKACCTDFVLGGEGACLWGVLGYTPAQRDAIRRRLREGFNEVLSGGSLFGSVGFSMALGREAQDAQALYASVENARLLLLERLLEGTQRLLEGDVPPSGLRDTDLLPRYTQSIGQALDTLDAEAAGAAAEALERAATAHPGVRGWELLELVQSAGMVFLARAGAGDAAGEAFRADCLCASSAQRLFGCLQKTQRTHLEALRRRHESRRGQPIRAAKKYIQAHFGGPLTLEEVSAATGFSPSYFSTLFKKETGEGFAKYLTHVRIEEAKTLLRDTRLSVAEICARVGYADLKHFTRTFRGETGITPGEFRKLYG